jgi:hypothetical protein
MRVSKCARVSGGCLMLLIGLFAYTPKALSQG